MAEAKTGTLERDASRRVALVTGGSRGIGRATALELAKGGYDVAIVYAGNEAAAEECVSLLKEAGATAKAYRCNVADADEANATAKQVQEDFGSVWALVNDAGITRDTLLARMKDEDFDAVIDVNLKGAFHMIRALMRGFVRQKGGRIVNVASVVGLSGNIGQANYAASKAGLCNAVAPGFIETAMTEKLPEATRASYEAQIPLKRLGTADEVAQVIAFLASDAASYVTGETIRIDGGLCM